MIQNKSKTLQCKAADIWDKIQKKMKEFAILEILIG